jgi:hypothetical protein
MLKNNKHVYKAKWHHNIFKMAVTGSKRRLPFIAFFNVHQVVCSTYINLGVHLNMTELVQQPIDQG